MRDLGINRLALSLTILTLLFLVGGATATEAANGSFEALKAAMEADNSVQTEILQVLHEVQVGFLRYYGAVQMARLEGASDEERGMPDKLKADLDQIIKTRMQRLRSISAEYLSGIEEALEGSRSSSYRDAWVSVAKKRRLIGLQADVSINALNLVLRLANPTQDEYAGAKAIFRLAELASYYDDLQK